MNYDQMRERIGSGQGFIAALDQSGGSTPKALKGYGIDEGAWADEAEMFGLIHAMRSRIITAPCFTGEKVLGAILFERTMNGAIDGQPVPAALIERGIVPFIKIDKGLEDEGAGGFGGVQMMKPMPELEALLDRAKALGVFGTKERSVINAADPAGIAAIVAQQFEVARRVLAKGMMPMIEPEISIKSPTRAECDTIMRAEILKHLDGLAAAEQVMLKLTLPVVPGTFDVLVDHPGVLKVVALSGGYARAEACAELAKNRGVIASFSRALLDDLRHGMSDDEFAGSLGGAIDEIHAASVA